MGAFGLPVFADWSAGFDKFSGATGGYLYGFIFGALLTGWFGDMQWDKMVLKAFVALLLGGLVILLVGFIHLNLMENWEFAVENGLNQVLLTGTTIKALIGALIWPLYYWLNDRHDKNYQKMFS